jgi:hypothetical protein
MNRTRAEAAFPSGIGGPGSDFMGWIVCFAPLRLCFPAAHPAFSYRICKLLLGNG